MLCFCREMKNLEVQAREEETQDGEAWYARYLQYVKAAKYDRNVGSMWASTQKEALLPKQLEDAMRKDTICGWTKIYNDEY